jgi:hypothetical protein
MNGDLQRRIEAQRSRQAERPTVAPDAPRTSGRRSNQWQRWMRWTHVYVSMVAFGIIGFFGVTGLLLNHPSWLGGDELVTTVVDGTLPESVRTEDGGVEFLAVSEYLRSEHGVVGEVTNFDQVGNEGSINYTGPAYGASVRFDVETLDYSAQITEEGFVNAMRDLHTGSDTNGAWSLVIDIAAGLLVVVALSGLGIQLFMRKRRRSALQWLAIGTVVVVLFGWLTLA